MAGAALPDRFSAMQDHRQPGKVLYLLISGDPEIPPEINKS